jgi:hypothetical protein
MRLSTTGLLASVVTCAAVAAAPIVRVAPASAAAGDVVIGAVGDMACDASNPNFHSGAGTATSCGQSRTSNAMLADTSLTAVLGLGDYQYDCGDPADYAVSYDPTWGRLDGEMHPAVGNHEYETGTDAFGAPCPTTNTTAAGYFDHFGASAHPNTVGHYSFDLGSWHLIALNANCPKPGVGGCSSTSAQTQWLVSDLAATTQPCILAFWHQPRFYGNMAITTYLPWWKALYAAHADMVLNGHIHNYQRFSALDPAGGLDSTNGISEYVVGTGGEAQAGGKSPAPRRLAGAKTFGYLRLDLQADGWTAKFIDTTGTVLDTTTGVCHP